jgi:restriction system protein
MIENPYPTDWKELQTGVCEIFNEVGLTADTEHKMRTPRGEVEIDVYAVDRNSVDQISYLVECKNWTTRVPQSVVHSFTTVMHEAGGNIGFIISKKGFQEGALEYLRNTNIVGLTYLELQQRYFAKWWNNYFEVTVDAGVDTLLQYVEPINTRRERLLNEMSAQKQKNVRQLQEKYFDVGMALALVGYTPNFEKLLRVEPTKSVAEFVQQISRPGIDLSFSSVYFRDLAGEIIEKAQSITEEFNAAFGRNIFA